MSVRKSESSGIWLLETTFSGVVGTSEIDIAVVTSTPSVN